MSTNLFTRKVDQLDPWQIEEECRELEDAYAEALSDNADFRALNNIWQRIQELHKAVPKDYNRNSK
jgi:hypothetical protein